jgi:putative ABC transport system permease protein
VKLALTELRRRPGPVLDRTVILTLIAILLMFLGGLLDGLIASSTGAIRAQDADAIVYSDTAQASFVRSRIEPQTCAPRSSRRRRHRGRRHRQRAARRPHPRQRTARPRRRGAVRLRDRADGRARGAAGRAGVGRRRPEGRRRRGRHGDRARSGRSPIEIVGFVSDTTFNGQASLWASPDTWREVLSANRPDAQLGPDVWQGLIVRGDGDDLPARHRRRHRGAPPSRSPSTVPSTRSPGCPSRAPRSTRSSA